MCRLCDKEERPKAREEYRQRAQELNDLAYQYLRIVDGKIEPHTDKMKTVGLLAKSIIRFLVNDWL